ncbi:MAG: APC family permease [Actinomycetota bacterium]|nr:APC family permease [Actinomycetota bacterium]
MLDSFKRLLVGRPLSSSEQEHQRIPKLIALPVFSSDAISSTAYATEEILFVTAVGASSLTLGLSVLVPIAIGVAILLTIVATSYRQTIFAYPNGGGAYVVSRDNLGEYPSLLAGASLMIDYVLTVAVSVSAGVAAIISIPAFRSLEKQRVLIGLLLIVLLTVGNLRGVRESGRIFAVPTYIYIVLLGALLAYGLAREFFGELGTVPFDPKEFHGREAGGELGLFLILKGFSSGAVALTGTEAIANGVPAFRKPQSKNAANTLVWMAVILGVLFFGTAVLAHHLRPFPTHNETVISQLGRVVFGEGPVYVVLQFATAAILTLAANTAYNGFPWLSSIIARDGYLPRQFANRGDRLVFSNGIVFLAAAAAVLLVAFGGVTTKLIPLYAVGVFTSFTLSQMGMVRHHLRLREPAWKRGTVVNAVGATATFLVLLIIAVTKFKSGAWVPLVVVPVIIVIFAGIRRHYDRVGQVLSVTPDEVHAEPISHTVVVLVGRIHKGVIRALSYARSLRPDHLAAVYVSFEDDDSEELQRQWEEFRLDVPLEVIHSPYRELVDAVEEYLDELDQRWSNDTITVLIPEFVVDRWFANVLHNQSALALKWALLRRDGTVVTSVPYHVHADDKGNGGSTGDGEPKARDKDKDQDQDRDKARAKVDGDSDGPSEKNDS